MPLWSQVCMGSFILKTVPVSDLPARSNIDAAGETFSTANSLRSHAAFQILNLDPGSQVWNALEAPEFLKGSCIPGKVPAAELWSVIFSVLGGSEGYTAARPDQDSCHTSQGCVIVQLWTQQVRVWLKGPFMVANLSRDIAFQQNEDQLKTHYRGGRSTGLATMMMIFDCSASAATRVKFISIGSSDFSLLYLLCIRMCLSFRSWMNFEWIPHMLMSLFPVWGFCWITTGCGQKA